MAVHQVFALGLGIVGQAHLPQRQFKVGFLDVVRVEIDGDQNEIAAVFAALAEIQNVVVPGVVELEPQVRVQRRVLAADAVELGDLGDDVARRGEVPRSDFVLLRVQVFLFARHRRGFA